MQPSSPAAQPCNQSEGSATRAEPSKLRNKIKFWKTCFGAHIKQTENVTTQRTIDYNEKNHQHTVSIAMLGLAIKGLRKNTGTQQAKQSIRKLASAWLFNNAAKQSCSSAMQPIQRVGGKGRASKLKLQNRINFLKTCFGARKTRESNGFDMFIA